MTSSAAEKSQMDQNMRRSCFGVLLLAFAAGCSTKSDTSNGPTPRTSGPSAREIAERSEAMAKSDKPKSSKQEEGVIDLPLYTKSVADYLKGSIARFAAKHPDVEVSCIALYFTNYGSSVWINYETRTHSDAWVKKYRGDKDHDYSIGKDAAGLFNKLPNDFEYGQADEFFFKGLPDFYEVKWPVKFRGLDGKVKEVDSYDESVGRVLLESFEPALKSFNVFGSLKRSAVFRMGIRVHNTDCEAFWLHTAPAPGKSDPAK